MNLPCQKRTSVKGDALIEFHGFMVPVILQQLQPEHTAPAIY